MNEIHVLQGYFDYVQFVASNVLEPSREIFSMNLRSSDLSRNIFVLVSFYLASRNLKNKKTPKFLLRRSFNKPGDSSFLRPAMVARSSSKKAFDSAFALWMIIQNAKRWLTTRPNENNLIKWSQESTVGQIYGYRLMEPSCFDRILFLGLMTLPARLMHVLLMNAITIALHKVFRSRRALQIQCPKIFHSRH